MSATKRKRPPREHIFDADLIEINCPCERTLNVRVLDRERCRCGRMWVREQTAPDNVTESRPDAGAVSS